MILVFIVGKAQLFESEKAEFGTITLFPSNRPYYASRRKKEKREIGREREKRSLERIRTLSSRAYHRKLREECETAVGKPWAQEGERKRERERGREKEEEDQGNDAMS